MPLILGVWRYCAACDVFWRGDDPCEHCGAEGTPMLIGPQLT